MVESFGMFAHTPTTTTTRAKYPFFLFQAFVVGFIRTIITSLNETEEEEEGLSSSRDTVNCWQ